MYGLIWYCIFFQCSYSDPSNSGITHLRISGWRVIVARLSGTIEMHRILTCSGIEDRDQHPRQPAAAAASTFGHRHSRSFSECGSSGGSNAGDGRLELQLACTHRVHQQPLTCLEIDHDIVMTGSQDHTLRILRVEKQSFTAIYTLHGHCGPITTAFIDRSASERAAAGSGSQDGMLCLWDALTGACLYSIQAHDGCVVSMTHSPSYVVSMGSDEKLCVWERFHGHLINSISLVSSGRRSLIYSFVSSSSFDFTYSFYRPAHPPTVETLSC